MISKEFQRDEEGINTIDKVVRSNNLVLKGRFGSVLLAVMFSLSDDDFAKLD